MIKVAGGCFLLRASNPTRPACHVKAWALAYQSSAGAVAGRTVARFSSGRVPEFAFAFDIDGVLLRSSKPLPGAGKVLAFLHERQIPFILLTNGGGKLERDRVNELSHKLGAKIDEDIFIQSHTPYAGLLKEQPKLANEPILVLGGEEDKCRKAAQAYGFKKVVIPSDIFRAQPEIWPFSAPFAEYHATWGKRLPLPLFKPNVDGPEPIEGKHLRIHSMFVYNDPRDMGLETQLALDLLLSHKGFLGTVSERNGRSDLPNHGFQDDEQPPLYFANPDLFWAAQYHLSRLGSGGFQASLRGIWDEVTGRQGIELKAINGGKPHRLTYQFAEQKVLKRWKDLHDNIPERPTDECPAGLGLKRIYMVGDNPASDITGANSFRSPDGRSWLPILVRSGVWKGEQPKTDVEKPYKIVDGVPDALQFVLREEGWV